jgi:glycosyltransferase involved in cell wall biosynthesis
MMSRKKRLKVAIGPVFDEYGGVSHHVYGIRKFSFHKIKVHPSRITREKFLTNAKRILYYQNFFDFIKLSICDVAHSHVDPWFTKLCSNSKARLWVHTYHSYYFEEDWIGGLKLWQEKINKSLIEVASKADVRISASKWLHDFYEEKYSIQSIIIPNGVDIEKLNTADGNRFRERHRMSDFVLFVGNLHPVKDPALFVQLADHIPSEQFLMIGRGIDSATLEKTYGVRIPKNIVLMSEMSREEVLDAIAACSVFVMTSKRETMPTVLLEALGLGKPVVAPAHSGCKEVIENRELGFLYEPESFEDLLEQTNLAMIKNIDGNKVKDKIFKNYSWETLVKRIDKIYEMS